MIPGKSETRSRVRETCEANPKRETNPNLRNRQTRSHQAFPDRHCRLGISSLFRVSIFGFRILLFLSCPFAFAASVNSPSTIDDGGLRTTSASYTMDSSVGGIGGISSASADTAKDGYIGQLTEVTSITATALPSPVSEFSNSQLSATATLDDATVDALSGADVTWSSSGIPYPLRSIDATGLAMATNVYANTSATINGYYLGGATSTVLAVLDTFPDDYGSYAGDGIPDSWQAQYFGLNNAKAAPNADADGTGQNNLFKYIAGLDPTNPASIFVLKIAVVAGLPSQKKLIYNPIATGRTYTLQFRTNLVTGAWATLTGITGPVTNITQATVTDTGATTASKFYRMDISLP